MWKYRRNDESHKFKRGTRPDKTNWVGKMIF